MPQTSLEPLLAYSVYDQLSLHLAMYVYIYRKIKSVEFMVCDILALVAEPLGLRDAIGDLQAYINLDDSMLQRVKLLVPEQYENPEAVRKVNPWGSCVCVSVYIGGEGSGGAGGQLVFNLEGVHVGLSSVYAFFTHLVTLKHAAMDTPDRKLVGGGHGSNWSSQQQLLF